MSGNPITIRSLGPEDAFVLDRVRPGVFDQDVDPSRAWAFLAARVNEMVVALDQGEVVGVAFGTTQLRPDKPTEFYINEVSVHPDCRRQGIARRLLDQLRARAMDRGCETVWLATDADNAAARGLYQRLGANETDGIVMYDWGFTD